MIKNLKHLKLVSECDSAEMVVTRHAADSYSAYCLETGFLAQGNWRAVAHAMRAEGLSQTEVLGLYQAVQGESCAA